MRAPFAVRRLWLGVAGAARHERLVSLACFVALTVALFWGGWRSPGTRWVGDPGDPPLFMWFLRWFPYALAHGENPLFTHHINHPDGVNLMWNTAMPLAGLVLSPLTMTLGPLIAYNVLVTLAVALSGWCAYVVLRRYVESRPGAALGALLYGFSPYMMAHALAHPNLPAAFVPPLMLAVIDEILVRQRRSPVAMGSALGGLAAAQLLLSEELLATEAIVAAMALAVLVVAYPAEVRGRVTYAVKALGVALAVALAVGGWPLAFQFLGPGRVLHGSLWSPDLFVSDLLSFVVPTGVQQLSPAWAARITSRFPDSCCVAEQNSYLGLPLIVFLTVAVGRLWSVALVRVAGVLAAAVAVLSMGAHLHVAGEILPVRLPLSVIAGRPVIGNVLASRLMVFVYLFAAVVVAVVVDRAPRRARGGWRATAAVAVVLVPLLPRVPFPSTRASVPAFFRSPAVDRLPEGSVALVAPFSRNTWTSEPMLWQAVADLRYRMPSGYALGPDRSGGFSYLPVPTPLSRAMEDVHAGRGPLEIDDGMREAWLAEVRDLDVDTVIVGPMLNQGEMVELFRWLLGREPVWVGGVHLWAQVRARLAERPP